VGSHAVVFLISILIACVLGVALWIARLVSDINTRFDQLEHKMDAVLDQLENRDS
jgi:hypothetical protein